MSVHIANQIIKKEWTDYNNHMNMAYYVLVFDQIWEIILEKFKMGEQSAKTTNMSTMVVETHTTYNNELKEGDEVAEKTAQETANYPIELAKLHLEQIRLILDKEEPDYKN